MTMKEAMRAGGFHAARGLFFIARESGAVRWRPIWKMLRWLYRQLCPAEGEVVERIAGRWWHLDLADRFFTQSLLLTGRHEEWEVPVFLDALRPGQWVVDIGAHVGFYTLLAAERVGPQGRVIAFEPDPSNRRLLAANVAHNRLTQVTIVPKAVTAEAGRLWLRRDPTNRGAHHVGPSAAGPEDVLVETVALDDFFDAEPAHAIDVMKIDVEGAEGLVWQGMQRLLAAQRVRWIMMEIWPERSLPEPAQRRRFAEEITRAGFQVSRIQEPSGALVPATMAQLPQLCAHGRGYTNLFLRQASQER